jgi:hypothetical protein
MRFFFRRRNDGRRSDSGSMPAALLITLTGVSLSAGLTNVVTGQIRDTQRLADRTAAVAAAQAGLDAALKAIRDTYAAAGALLTKLPCTTLVDSLTTPGYSGASTPTFSTSIGYFLTDPSTSTTLLSSIGDLTNINKLAAGTASLTSTVTNAVGAVTAAAVDKTKLANTLNGAVACVNGVLQQVPLYGLLRSVGKAGAASRTLYATYTFRTTEDTIPGGQITLAANGAICLGDANAEPKAGDPVSVVPCATAGTKATTFVYPTNLSLVLSQTRTSKYSLLGGGSVADTYPYGLCVTASEATTSASLTYQPCVVNPTTTLAKQAMWKQQWQLNVNAKTYYGTSNGSTSNGLCLSLPYAITSLSQVPAAMVLSSSCSNAQTRLDKQATVGAGSAGYNTGQLVSAAEVGNCLDVTNEDVSGKWAGTSAPALITYPCKQSFDGNTYWNHKWTTPTPLLGALFATGQISTLPASNTDVGIPYCLKSPGPTGGVVWVGKCSGLTADLVWTVWGAALTYKDSYRIVDVYGNCLMPGKTLGYTYSGWSKVITAPCDGSEVQKWNRPAYADANPLKGLREN